MIETINFHRVEGDAIKTKSIPLGHFYGVKITIIYKGILYSVSISFIW